MAMKTAEKIKCQITKTLNEIKISLGHTKPTLGRMSSLSNFSQNKIVERQKRFKYQLSRYNLVISCLVQ